MKRRDLLKKFYKAGWKFEREGSDHTIISKDGKIEQIPRHREVNEQLAKAILRKHGVK